MSRTKEFTKTLGFSIREYSIAENVWLAIRILAQNSWSKLEIK